MTRSEIRMTCEVVNLSRAEDPKRCRKFTLSDAMILVAGTAFSLAISPFLAHPIANLIEWLPRLCKEATAHTSYLFEHWPAFWAAIRFPLIQCLWFSCGSIELYVLGMTLPFLALRLKRPRPALRGLLRQPGMVASLAIVLGLIWVAAYLDYLFFFFQSHMHLTRSTGVGGTVAVAWAILTLGRRWQAEPGWIDRLGQSLGYAAICVALVVPLIYQL
jgi:hypothetical protein